MTRLLLIILALAAVTAAAGQLIADPIDLSSLFNSENP